MRPDEERVAQDLSFGSQQQVREQAGGGVAEAARPVPAVDVGQGQGDAVLEVRLEDLLGAAGGVDVVDPHHGLLVEAQAADVEVQRADARGLPIDGERLGVEEALLPAVDVDARLQQLLEVGLGGVPGDLLVQHAGQQQVDPDAAGRGIGDGLHRLGVGDEVGGLDEDAVLRPGDGHLVRARGAEPGVIEAVHCWTMMSPGGSDGSG